jgi:hypothetical protein
MIATAATCSCGQRMVPTSLTAPIAAICPHCDRPCSANRDKVNCPHCNKLDRAK